MITITDLLGIYKPEIEIISADKGYFEGFFRDQIGRDIPIEGSYDEYASNEDEGFVENVVVYRSGTEIKFSEHVADMVADELAPYVDAYQVYFDQQQMRAEAMYDSWKDGD